jgi:hypothetical protein
MTATTMLQSKRFCRCRGRQALTFVAGHNDNAAGNKTYWLKDSKSATIDAIGSNPADLAQQSTVIDRGEEYGSGCSGDSYRKKGNNCCKWMMADDGI